MADQPGKTAPTNLNNVSAPPAKTGIQLPPAANVIAWSVGSDGTFSAQTSGQQLALAAAQLSDGSVQLQLVFSRTGQSPYLTITSLVQPAKNSVSLTFSASPSLLTLAISGYQPGRHTWHRDDIGFFRRPGCELDWKLQYEHKPAGRNATTGMAPEGIRGRVGVRVRIWTACLGAKRLVADDCWLAGRDGGAPSYGFSWAGWTIVKAVVVGGIAAAATLATTPVSVPHHCHFRHRGRRCKPVE